MSPVDIWVSVSYAITSVPKDFDFMFQSGGKKRVLIVESQDEYDYCWAMQLIYGGEITIVIDRSADLRDYLNLFTWVFTTWDPSDRNRI